MYITSFTPKFSKKSIHSKKVERYGISFRNYLFNNIIFIPGDIPSTFKQFFATTLGLKYLNLSHCKLPIDALKHLLLGLACNESTSDVELNISNNNLGSLGAGVMENALPGVTCVSRLDVSENNLDVELASVVNGVARNKSLLSLNISKNLPKIKARDVVHVMEAIVQLIQVCHAPENMSARRGDLSISFIIFSIFY